MMDELTMIAMIVNAADTDVLVAGGDVRYVLYMGACIRRQARNARAIVESHPRLIARAVYRAHPDRELPAFAGLSLCLACGEREVDHP